MRRRGMSPSYRLAVFGVKPVLTLVTRRDWRGAEHLPRSTGYIVCSNHLSYADPFTLAHFLYDHGALPRFLGKEAVLRVPVAGRILRGAGQIPVYRESGDASLAFSAAVDAVRAGECVPMYPEGSLTRDPDLWPMRGKTGAARVALTTRCPVIPVAQWGPQDVLAPYGKRLHLLPPRRLRVEAGPPVDLSRFEGKELDKSTLLAATDAILDDITRILERLRGQKAPPARWDPRDHGQPPTGNYKQTGNDKRRTG